MTPSCHKGRERRRLKEEIVHALMDLTRLRVIWYLRRITVRQSRCSTSGTTLNVSSWGDRSLARATASAT